MLSATHRMPGTRLENKQNTRRVFRMNCLMDRGQALLVRPLHVRAQRSQHLNALLESALRCYVGRGGPVAGRL